MEVVMPGVKVIIGVDIVDIERVQQAVERTPRFLYRVFTNQELKYCLNKKNPFPSLAVRYAAKEALRKLDPVFASGIRFQEVEVGRDDRGIPKLLLHGGALDQKKQANIGEISLSLSHAEKQAIAAVTAWKG